MSDQLTLVGTIARIDGAVGPQPGAFMRTVRYTLLALLLILSGCSGIEDPLSTRELRELVSARTRWNASPVRTAYRYEVRQSCFCPSEFVTWNTVTVIDGVVVEVRTEEGSLAPQSLWSAYPTVERLFLALTESQEDEYLDEVTVRFDPQYGYPLEMNFITSPEIADGGGAYFARNLRAAARPSGAGGP